MKRPATPPGEVAKVIAQARAEEKLLLALYVWLAAITGARRGELCALQISGIDLENKALHIGFNYVVRDGQKLRKDTKTHQDRWIALDNTSCAFIAEVLTGLRSALAAVGLALPEDAYLFSNDAMHATPWNPDWASHAVGDLADAVGVDLNIKKLRHYTASQLLAARFDLQNTAARLGHGSGGATQAAMRGLRSAATASAGRSPQQDSKVMARSVSNRTRRPNASARPDGCHEAVMGRELVGCQSCVYVL